MVWIVFSDGVVFYFLLSVKVMVLLVVVYVFFFFGGESDSTMREIYIKSIELGVFDKVFSGWVGDDYFMLGWELLLIIVVLVIYVFVYVILLFGVGVEIVVSTLR